MDWKLSVCTSFSSKYLSYEQRERHLHTDLLSFKTSFTKARAIALFYLVALPYKDFASKIFIKEPF